MAAISPKMQEALNKQLNAELYSGYLYLSMAAHFRSANLDGFANWMRKQAEEELAHAMKFYDYLHERGARVELAAIQAPPTAWDSPLAAFEDAYRHEQSVTASIHELMDLARSERDHPTAIFLEWFVTEQVEEESSVDAVIQKLKLMRDAPGGMFMLNRELAART